MQMFFKRVLGVLLVSSFALMSACTLVPKIDEGQLTEETRVGRFSVLAYDKQDNVNKNAVQGGFIWRELGSGLEVDLTNPLGNTLARVEVSDFQAVLIDTSGRRIVAVSPDDLMARVLDGRPLPVSGLRYWVRGELMPNTPAEHVKRDEKGRLLSAEQHGWQVNLSDYDAKGPTRLRLVRNEAVERITVRLTVDH